MSVVSSLAQVSAVDALSGYHFRFGIVGVAMRVRSRLEFFHWVHGIVSKRAGRLHERAYGYNPLHQASGRRRKRFLRVDPVNAFDSDFDILSTLNGLICRCREFLARLDNKYTIDHTPPKDVVAFLDDWSRERVLRFSKVEVFRKYCEVAAELAKQQRLSRMSIYRERLQNAIDQAAKKGWFVVFDTLTVAPCEMPAFLADPLAIRDHVRKIGRMVNVACGVSARESFADRFQYFIVPELGSTHGRLHFYAVYLMQRLPRSSRDPNLGRPIPFRREVTTLKVWDYGYSSPIACRFSGDAFTKAGWLWPVTKKFGQYVRLEAKPATAIAFYVAGYAQKNLDYSEKHKCLNQPRYKIRMSRGFGTEVPTMKHLPDADLIQLVRIHWSVHKRSRLIRNQASATLRKRLATQPLRSFMESRSTTQNLLSRLRDLIQTNPDLKPLNSANFGTRSLMIGDLSDAAAAYIRGFPVDHRTTGLPGK